jgi:ribonuclease E
MREEPRAGDTYGWSWPARPVGDDPYQWRGPVQAQLAPAAIAESVSAPVAQVPVAEAPQAPEPGPQPPIDEGAASVDVWVELPAADEAPRKAGRSRRGRAKAVAADSAAAEAPAVEPTPVAEVAAPGPEPVLEPVAIEVEVAPEPVLAVIEEAPAPVAEPPPAPRPIDVNEIVAPPAAPKRGWWRRGA